jgi:hypothetical protein
MRYHNLTNVKRFLGVGCLGDGVHKSRINGKQTREYNLWANMLTRCYNHKLHAKHPTYLNCTVSEEWLNFQNFCRDIPKIKGYILWKNNHERYDLDKDKTGSSIYSLSTCEFITKEENIRLSGLTGYSYVAKRISDGYIEEFNNQSFFARKYNLCAGHISKCINGKLKTHKGWMFDYLKAEKYIKDNE